MNSLGRIVAALTFETPDRPPVIPQVFGHAAVLAGQDLPHYLQSGETLAKFQLQALAYYEYDAVFGVMDTSVETEAFGSELVFRPGFYPHVGHYVLTGTIDPDLLSIPDPVTTGREPEMLQALHILRETLGDEVLVVGCVLGPFSVLTQLMGMETALYLAVDQPNIFKQILEITTKAQIWFGTAQIEAGAHLPMIFEPAASPAVVPPQFFRELLAPSLRKLVTALKNAGSIATWLHIAGPTGKILPYYPELGVDLANFDYEVSPDQVKVALPGTCVDGNLKSALFLETPEEISREADFLLAAFAERGGFILSSGCEIPPESNPDAIKALVRAALRV